jgi:hypothetical protein
MGPTLERTLWLRHWLRHLGWPGCIGAYLFVFAGYAGIHRLEQGTCHARFSDKFPHMSEGFRGPTGSEWWTLAEWWRHRNAGQGCTFTLNCLGLVTQYPYF